VSVTAATNLNAAQGRSSSAAERLELEEPPQYAAHPQVRSSLRGVSVPITWICPTLSCRVSSYSPTLLFLQLGATRP
jgi:hypothetical protein